MGSLTWTVNKIPQLSGRHFIVTGGNSGIGFETAKHLALKGGHVVIATHEQKPGAAAPKDFQSGNDAVEKIKSTKPDAFVEYMPLDLASFKSIHRFAEDYNRKGFPLHVLVNNGGLMAPPDARTEDGFEVTMGINFFGPFYLTQLLLPKLKQSAPSRIVWVSSPEEGIAGDIDWTDLRGDKLPTDVQTYAKTKLLDLMVAFEYNRRLAGTGVESFACEPGVARTDIFRKGDHDKMALLISDWAQFIAGHSAESGAQSLLYSATAPELQGKGGTYYGCPYLAPGATNIFNTTQRHPQNSQAKDPALAARLYDEAMRIVNETAQRANLPLPLE